jgi:hypothetical protein
MASAAGTALSSDRAWFIVGRWQEYQGEARANLLRVVALVVFYGVQLAQYLRLAEPDAANEAFQQHVTQVVAAWSLMAVAILILMQRRIFPAALKYVSTAGDVILLTLLASQGGGPSGPLVHVYFLIIALAAMRFSVGLIWLATIGSMFGYLALVGLADPKWFDAEHTTPIADQLVTLASLGVCGLILGQAVRHVRKIAASFAELAPKGGRA